MLERLRPALDFTIAEVSIESDPALIDRYIFAIPVVALGELEIARAPLSATRLEDALREALSLE